MSDMLPLEMEMRVEEEEEDDPDVNNSYSDVEEEQEEELPAPVAVNVFPFGEEIHIKQEVDECSSPEETSFHEEVDIKEEEVGEDKGEEEILPSVPTKVETKVENTKLEEEDVVVVEPCLPVFKPTKEEKKISLKEEATTSAGTVVDVEDDSSEEEVLPEAAMVVVPGRCDDDPEDFVEENIAIKAVVNTPKRQKIASKRVDTVYRCPNCSLCYTSPEYLAGHVRRGCRYRPTPIKNAFRCITCGEGFSNYGELYQHKRLKHDSEKKSSSPPKTIPASKNANSRGLPCPNCPRYFSTPGYLVQHMRAHARSRTDVACDVCGEKLAETSQGKMEEHFITRHAGMPIHRCGECGRAYGHRHNLVNHLLSHSGTEDLRCYICNKDFGSRPLLSSHLRSHPSTRPFECSVCGKTYLQQGRFYEHRRREHGIIEKPIASRVVMWARGSQAENSEMDAAKVIIPDSSPGRSTFADNGRDVSGENIGENGSDCEIVIS